MIERPLQQDSVEAIQSTDSCPSAEAMPPMTTIAPFDPSFTQSLHACVDSTFFGVGFSPVNVNRVASLLHTTTYQAETPCRSQQQVAVFLFPFLLYLFFLAFNRRQIIYQSKVSRRLGHFGGYLLFHGDEVMDKPLYVLNLMIALVLGAACSCWVLLTGAGYLPGNWSSWGIIFACIIGYVFLKWLFFSLSALLLDVWPETVSFLREKSLFYYNVLLLSLPFVFIDYFYPFVPMWLVCIVLALSFGYMLVRSFFIFSQKMNLFGIFLYFCTLEFLPLSCLVKLLLSY